MRLIYSNGPEKDYVYNALQGLLQKSGNVYLAAPYVTETACVLEAQKRGAQVSLLVGLNAATCPKALRQVHGIPGVGTRYHTGKFHAKIFLGDGMALLGSSNLTNGGLQWNREATILLEAPEDGQALEELKTLFSELWESAAVLTNEKLEIFAEERLKRASNGPQMDEFIANAVGKNEPFNANIASRGKSKERLFEEDLRRRVYEQYDPAFTEVSGLLDRNGFRRGDLGALNLALETNRFLNWVRLEHAPGERWQDTPPLPPAQRADKILDLGRQWRDTAETHIPDVYFQWLSQLRRILGSTEALADATKEDLSEALQSIHVFYDRRRFTKGGGKNQMEEFWNDNGQNVKLVKANFRHLLYGQGDFIHRLHDCLYDGQFKVRGVGLNCSLEMFGTLQPEICPPMNSRMAKALRFLGFDVLVG